MLQSEWDKVMLGESVSDDLKRLQDERILNEDFPEVQVIVGFGGLEEGHKDLWSHTCMVVEQTPPKLEVRWAALFHDVGKVQCFRRIRGEIQFHGHEIVSARQFLTAAKRRKWDKTQRDTICFLVRHLGHIEEYDSSWTDSAIRRLGVIAGEHLQDLVSLARADITTKHAYKRRAHRAKMDELEERLAYVKELDSRVPALVTGLGIVLTQELGIPPSKALGDLMKSLTAAVECGELARQAEPSVILEYIRTNKLVQC